MNDFIRRLISTMTLSAILALAPLSGSPSKPAHNPKEAIPESEAVPYLRSRLSFSTEQDASFYIQDDINRKEVSGIADIYDGANRRVINYRFDNGEITYIIENDSLRTVAQGDSAEVAIAIDNEWCWVAAGPFNSYDQLDSLAERVNTDCGGMQSVEPENPGESWGSIKYMFR